MTDDYYTVNVVPWRTGATTPIVIYKSNQVPIEDTIIQIDDRSFYVRTVKINPPDNTVEVKVTQG